MLQNAKPLTADLLKQFSARYDARPENRAYNAAFSKNEIPEVVYCPMEGAKLDSTFSVEVKTRGITNQMSSGRCWLFASMNLMREKVAEKCNLEKPSEVSVRFF